MTRELFDIKCHDLAAMCLSDTDTPQLDTEDNINALAVVIQTVIEDFIDDSLMILRGREKE